jgi:hypothetical protein
MGWSGGTHRRNDKYDIFLVGKPFVRPRGRCEDIRMDLRETGWKVVV